jgi:hypothetical protein
MTPIKWALLPKMEGELFFMALSRYSNEAYKNERYGFYFDVMCLFLLPFLGFYMLRKSICKPNVVESSAILVEAISLEYKNSTMSILVDELGDEDVRFVGEDLDCDGIADNKFLRSDAWRIILIAWLIFPYVMILTLLGKVSFGRALLKTLVVYYRSYRFFQCNSADVFVTIRDNGCSAALYSAFHASGGKYFCAVQNGLRFGIEGIGFSCFDHLFANTKRSVEVYQMVGGQIEAYDIVPTLSLDQYLGESTAINDIDIDILFIDQGFPVNGLEMWLPANTGKDVLRFLDQVKKFALNNKELNIVYLMRRYEDDLGYIRSAIGEWAKGTGIILCHPHSSYQSYHTVAKSRLVVTMDSTLGVEALSLGRDALFFNLKDDKILEICAAPYQHRLNDYQYFEKTLNNALLYGIQKNKKIIDYYAPPRVTGGAKFIATKIKKYANQ